MTDSDARHRREVRRQYERWPYPFVPVVGAVPRHHTWQLNAEFWRDRCGLPPGPDRPRIWIAGCGTMQPYVFRLANPNAHITATDVSEHSLRIARRRCLWHGEYGVDFEFADLTDPPTCPDGPFDVIECYGVLMNLPDPGAALRLLASRLAPGGVLRIMVYPHYGRRRIFQVQRVAKLCGLRFDRRGDPARLRTLMSRLPKSHPLRFAFDTYSDARNDAGLVDGFLHAGDRGFTGLELGDLCRQAKLRPAFWFHREWARPDVMAARLELEHTSEFFVAHYLDLWQELRGNFVVCLTHDDESRPDAPAEVETSPPQARPLRIHPGMTTAAARGPLEWLGRRTLWPTLGLVAPDRLADEPLRLSARLLRRAQTPTTLEPADLAALSERGAVFGDRVPRSLSALPAFGGAMEHSVEPLLEVGRDAANPFYQHLFDAWSSGPESSGGWLPRLAEQLKKWRPEAEALENDDCPVGLTPFGSVAALGEDAIACIRERRQDRELASSWAEWSPVGHEQSRVDLERWSEDLVDMASIPPDDIAELWCLVCSAETFLFRP